MSKIIGNPVGTTLPKPDFKQTDPTKGDYIKNKPEVVDATVGQFLAIKTIDEDGHISELESIEASVDITELTDEEIAEICDFDGDASSIIPIATPASIGCVSVGDGLDIDDNGLLSVQALTDAEIESICEFDEGMTEGNVIPKATKTALGCIKVGDGLVIDSSGRLSATGGGSGVATAGIGSSGMKLLWENPNPTAEFGAQTIELDLSGYDECLIEYNGTTAWNVYSSIAISKGKSFFATVSAGNLGAQASNSTTIYTTNRLFTMNDDGIVCSNGYAMTSGGSVVANDGRACIPYRIYGVDIAPPNVDYTLTEEKDISKDLLWTNPNPTAEFAAQTISLDLSEYDFIFIKAAGYPNVSSDYPAGLIKWFEVKKNESTILDMNVTFFNTSTSSNAYWGGRTCIVSDTGVNFEQGISYKVNDTTSHVGTSSNGSVVPIEIYGIKNKINVTTAVVTDKGQHTNLLWENASPTTSFTAQTISLDLNGYDEYEVEFALGSDVLCYDAARASVGKSVFLSMNDALSIYRRKVTYSSGSLEFSSASAARVSDTASSTNDDCLIPTKIYGIKHNAATTSTIMGDYVIEEGTEGIWTYRKWNSGIAECWGEPQSGALTMSASGSVYVSAAVYVSVPAFLKSVDNIAYNSHNANVIGISNYGTFNITDCTVGVRVQKSTNATDSVKFAARIFGRWK